MGMSNKEALERGFDFKYYNPFVSRGDFVGITIIIMILLFSFIGLFYYTKFFLVISILLGLSQAIVTLIDFLTAERIKFVKRE